MAERSKAPVSGTGLFGGVGSNPTPIICFAFFAPNLVVQGRFIFALGAGGVDDQHGWMAERSKALVLGTSLFGGVGSNPTPIIYPR